ncbi:hypothetical protein ACFW04_001863 [Cataglyphis niger]
MDEYLELIMFKKNEDLSEIDIKHHLNSFLVIIAKHAKYDNVLSNILKNFNNLISWDTNGIAIFIVIVNHVYSKKQLDEIRKFTRYIFETEMYINHIKYLFKEKRTLFVRANIDAYFDEFKNVMKQWMLYAEHKLQIRLSEIERQMSYLKILSEKKKVG